MASKGTPLGIGLGIDFNQLDVDLGKVASKIENVGKTTTLKVGTASALAATGGIKADDLAAQMATIGVKLRQGMGASINTSDALMLAHGARINAMLDRLAGTAITMFERIDASMKFPKFDASMGRWSARLRAFFLRGKLGATDLEKALAGGFGEAARATAKIMVPLFADISKRIGAEMTRGIEAIEPAMTGMARTIADSFDAAIARMIASLDRLGSKGKAVEADVAGVMSAPEKVAAPSRFPAQAGRAGIGRALGANILQERGPIVARATEAAADFIGKIPQPAMLKDFVVVLKGIPSLWGKVAQAAMGAYKSMQASSIVRGLLEVYDVSRKVDAVMFRGFAGLGAGFLAVARKIYGMQNFLTSLGNVGDKTYTSLIAGNRKWITLMGLLPVGVAVKAVTLLGRAASYLPSVFGTIGRNAMWAFGNVIPSVIPHAISLVRQLFTWSTSTGESLSLAAAAAKAFSLVKIGVVNMPVGGYLLAAKAALALFNRLRGVQSGAAGAGASMAAATGRASVLGGVVSSIAHPVRTLTHAFSGLGAQMLAAFGVVGIVYKVVEFFKSGITAASDLNETVSRSKVVFGESFGMVEEQAKANERAFSLSETAQLNVAAGFGAMATGAGMGQEAAAKLANQLTQMAGDLQSSVTIPFEEAGQKIRGALAGETEPLRQFGATITEDSVKAQMLKANLNNLADQIDGVGAAAAKVKPIDAGKFGGRFGAQATLVSLHAGNAARVVEQANRRMAIAEENRRKGQLLAMPKAQRPAVVATRIAAMPHVAGEQETKMLARATLLMQGLSYAQGDMARTAGEARNQFVKAGGGVAVFGRKIGELLLPAVKAGAVGFNELLGGALDLIEKFGPVLQSWATSAADAVSTVVANVRAFGPVVVENVTWAWNEAKKGPLGFVIEAAEAVANFASDIPAMIGVAVRNAGTLWEIAKLQVGEFAENSVQWFNTLPENLGRIFGWIGRNWWNLLKDMGKLIFALVKQVGENIKDIGEGIWDALSGGGIGKLQDALGRITTDIFSGKQFKDIWNSFEKSTEVLPEMVKPALISVKNQTDALFRKIGEDELAFTNRLARRANAAAASRALAAAQAAAGIGSVMSAAMGAAAAGIKPGELPGPKKPGPIGEPVKAAEYKLASAVEIGTKEASSIIAKSLSSGSRLDPAKEGVRVAKDSNAKLDSIDKGIKAIASKPGMALAVK